MVLVVPVVLGFAGLVVGGGPPSVRGPLLVGSLTGCTAGVVVLLVVVLEDDGVVDDVVDDEDVEVEVEVEVGESELVVELVDVRV